MLALGCASVRELEQRCTIDEIELWLEFLAVEPTGDQRADDRARAIVMKIHDFAPTRYKLERSDILATPYESWKREQERQDPIMLEEKKRATAYSIAKWLGVDLGETPEWQ